HRTQPILDQHPDQQEGSKLSKARTALLAHRFLVLQTYLPTIAEDQLLHFSGYRSLPERIVEVCPSGDIVGDERDGSTITLSNLLRDTIASERDAIVYYDLRKFPARDAEGIQRDIGQSPDTPARLALAKDLSRRNLHCLFFLPAYAHLSIRGGGSDRMLFSIEEEQSILVKRSAWREGKVEETFAVALRKQMSEGFWGNDPIQIFNKLHDELRFGDIRERVNEYVRISNDVDRATTQYAKRIELLFNQPFSTDAVVADWPNSLLQDSVTRARARHALFLMTYFDEMTLSDFGWLIRTILKGKTVAKRQEVFSESGLDQREGDQSSDVAPVEASPPTARASFIDIDMPLEGSYEEWADEVLQLIDVALQPNGRLAFVPAFKAQIAAEHFRSKRPVLASRMREELLEGTIFFDASEEVAGKLADRFVEHLRQQPDSVRLGSLLDLMRSLASQFVSSRVPRFKPQGKVAPWTDLAEHLQPDLLREYARRAGLVLSKLVREPSSRPLVDAVLSGILQDGEASGSKQELVQSFLGILRRENGFDILPWLKRFLSQGENEIKRSSLGLLANAIEFSDTQVENHVLLALRSWLPETVGPASGLNSQTAALLAPRVAMYRTFGRTRDREHGKVDRLAPLVDLNREDGFLPEYKIAIDLLPR